MRDMLRLFEITPVMSTPVHYRITIQSPGLTPRPGRRVGITLGRFFSQDRTRSRIIIYYMVRAIVRTKMIPHSRIGMCDGNPVKGRDAANPGGPEQELQVHHVVDNDREFPGLAVPRPDTAYRRVEPGRQRTGAVEQHILVLRPVQQAKPVAITAIHHEAQVMGPLI